MRIYSACQKIGVGAFVFLYFCSNVVLGYSAESHFWGERRRAARGEQASTSLESRSLLAGLPGAQSVDPLQSLSLDHRPGVGLDPASSLGKAVAESSDSRVHRIAQSILPFGNVRFVRESKKAGAPLVLHIQDVHGNLEAQQNIAEMVLALGRDHGVRLVGLEGAWGAFATDEFKPYPDQDIVKKVGRHFLKKDFISGAEYAGLASETPLTLWGIEDPALYRANVDAVKQSLAGQARAEEFLASLIWGLDSLKKIHYSPQLLAFDTNQSLYDQNRRGLGEYLQTLVDDDGRDLSTLSVQVPNVVRFLGALNEERSLDFVAVERERQGLVKVLSEKLSPDELQTLLSHSIDLRAGTLSHNTYHIYLRDLCARKGVSLGLRPSLLAYMHYVAVSEEIERDGLLIEMDGLVESAQNALIENSEQRKLVSLSRDAHLLKKLFANEMTPEEWGTYVGRQEQTRRLEERFKALAPKAEVQWPEDLAGLLSPFEAFCARAMDRNRALTQNLANTMGEEKQTVAVLVAGGFHTDGLMEALARQEASVLVLTPKIGPIDTTHRYLNVFAQDPIPLEKIFTGEPIALKALCALSGEAPSRATRDGLHLGIVSMALKLKEGFLRSIHAGNDEIRRELQHEIDDLSRQVQFLSPLGLEMDFAGANGQWVLRGQTGGNPFVLYMGGDAQASPVFQRNGVNGHQMAKPPSSQPKPNGQATSKDSGFPHYLLFAPFLLFSSIYTGDSLFSLLHWGTLTFGTIAILHAGIILFNRLGRTKTHSHTSLSGHNSSLIDDLVNEYHAGTWRDHPHRSLLSGVSIDDIHLRLDRIAQNVIAQELSQFPLREQGVEGNYRVFSVPELNLLIKVPPEKSKNARPFYEKLKNGLGGLFAPMTRLDSFKDKKGNRYRNVIVQEAVRRIPNPEEQWPQNGDIGAYQLHHLTSNRHDIKNHFRVRQTKIADFIASFSSRGVTFRDHSKIESHLGLTNSNQLVAFQMGQLVIKNPDLLPNKRVPDVLESKIRRAQKEELNQIIQNGGIPHSVVSVSFAVKVFRWMGMAERAAKISGNVLVGLVVPIFETLAYGFGTPALAALFVSVPFGLGIVMAPVLVGFISAVIHVIAWKWQGENIGVRDFINWWVGGTLYSSFFAVMPSTGWAGETPWELSGFTHILVNSVIVAGTTRRMGRLFGLKWLERLKPGSVLGSSHSVLPHDKSLTDKERTQLRRYVMEIVSFVSDPAGIKQSYREFQIEFSNRSFTVSVGSVHELEELIKRQIKETEDHPNELKPIQIIDSWEDPTGPDSYLVTEVTLAETSEPPSEMQKPVRAISQEEFVQALFLVIASTYKAKGNNIFSRESKRDLMRQLKPYYLKEGERDDGRPTKSIMVTATGVILAVMNSNKWEPELILAYLQTAKTFRDVFAMYPDVKITEMRLNEIADQLLEPVNFSFENLELAHKEFVAFMNKTNSRSAKTVKSDSNKGALAERRVPQQMASPVPEVLPVALAHIDQEPIDLRGLLLGGGKSINLDLLLRSYRIGNDYVVPQDAQDYRQFIRQMVRENWAAPHTQDEWLSSLQTQRWEGVALPVGTVRGDRREDYASSLRWWVLGELWLAVAGPRDWLNWRFYVVLFRERVLFRHNAGFSKQERIARAASYIALLRAAEKSVLLANGKRGGAVAQKFDIDLLHGAVGATGPEWRSLFDRVYYSYNQILEQWTRVSLWGQFVQGTKPTGIHVFDVDSLVADSTYDANKQREVASALAALLLAYDNGSLAQQVFLVTSAPGADGSSMSNVQLAEHLKTKYGPVFNRVKDVRLLTQEEVHDLYTSEEGNAQSTIHLDPLLVHLKLVDKANLVRFWTHDASRVATGKLRILVIPILKLAARLQEFFKRRTFIQTFA
jgi:hypothetical protein